MGESVWLKPMKFASPWAYTVYAGVAVSKLRKATHRLVARHHFRGRRAVGRRRVTYAAAHGTFSHFTTTPTPSPDRATVFSFGIMPLC